MADRYTEEDRARDADLLAELGSEAQPDKVAAHTPEEERVMAGFEDIRTFTDVHGRPPVHGEDRDIFERLYAVRLDRLRALTEYHALLAPLDRQGLLTAHAAVPDALHELDDDELLAELGVETDTSSDITNLTHVRSVADKRAAEEIANRTPCKDFDTYKSLFAQVRKELDNGVRKTRAFGGGDDIESGDFFVLGGQIVYVAGMGEEFFTEYERKDRRLRVIYDNGTESDLLQRSLQRALYRDTAARRIISLSAGPLFADQVESEDTESGTIYVLRSRSDHPMVAANRDIIHKIGVTGGAVEKRIANAKLDPTFLMADVEVIATYELYNLNRTKLENLIHRIFAPACLDIEIEDRFGNPVAPREWFLVPLHVINEAVERINDGTITDYTYDADEAGLVECARAR